MAYNRLTLPEKIAAKTRQEGDCLVWTGQKDAKGYGFLRLGGRKQRAHRLVYALHCGAIPDGLVVLHSCDNPSCVNRLHLSVGTQRSNIDDMRAKGRQRHLLGEECPVAKLTESQVREMRRRFIPYDRKHGTRAMAREFGLTHESVSAAISGKTWKHLP